MLQGGLYQPREQRMGTFRRALVFRMELGADEEGVARQFHHLYQAGFRIPAGSLEAVLLKFLQIVGIELVAVTMAFGDLRGAV